MNVTPTAIPAPADTSFGDSLNNDFVNEPLTSEEINERIVSGSDTYIIPYGNNNSLNLSFSWVSQRGFYPESLDKANQDAFLITPKFNNNDSQVLFGVFDGHGKYGDKCAQFARDRIGQNIAKSELFQSDFEKAYFDSFVQTNNDMHRQRGVPGGIDDSMSGTTAITVFFNGTEILVANVGDSRAMVCEETSNGKRIPYALSIDQTPFRVDERKRCQAIGARVLTMDQIDGYKDATDTNWGSEEEDDGDPPRLWLPNKRYPGTAFTRSIGDAVAETIGVTAEPEILVKRLTKNCKYLVIASDGVFEFLTNENVLEIIEQFDDMLEACQAIVSESYRLWLQYEVRTDDITCIIINLEGLVDDDRVSERTNLNVDAMSQKQRPVRRAIARAKRQEINMGDNAKLTDEELNFVPPDAFHGNDDERNSITQAVRANFLFQHLNENQRKGVFNSMVKVVVKEGDVIISQGDPGDKFYIVLSGRYDVLVSPKKSEDDDKVREPVVVHTYNSDGDHYPSFGELALMYDKPRAASVVAVTDGVLWALHRTAFRSILMKSSASSLIKILSNVPVFKTLDHNHLQRLSDMLTQEHFNDGDYIITQGDIGDTFYVVKSGTVRITKTEGEGKDSDEIDIMTLGENSYFGERALLSGDTRAANVIAEGRVSLLYIGRAAFEEVLGPLQDIIDSDRKHRELIADQRSLMANRCNEEGIKGVGIQDLVIKGTIDITNVHLVEHTSASKCYGLIRVSKSQSVDDKKTGQVIEGLHRSIAFGASSKSVAEVLATFSDSKFLYALINRTPVCSLADILPEGEQFSESDIIFYLASITAGIGAVHSKGYHFRSLSPEKILLDSDGYPLLWDFNLSKNTTSRSFTLCGTSDYMSPEQVTNKGADYTSDWWSVGVLAYELFTGEAPFSTPESREMEVYATISEYKHKSLEIAGCGDKLSDFIHSLLNPSITDRLGSGGGNSLKGYKDVMNHELFLDFDWDSLNSGEIVSPHRESARAFFEKFVSGEMDIKLDDDVKSISDEAWCKEW